MVGTGILAENLSLKRRLMKIGLMLAGMNITPQTLKHAEEMLSQTK